MARNQKNEKTDDKGKKGGASVIPGAAMGALAGAVAGVAIGTTLSDKKKRDQIMDKLGDLRDEVLDAVEDVHQNVQGRADDIADKATNRVDDVKDDLGKAKGGVARKRKTNASSR